jgi:hypothetical protein
LSQGLPLTNRVAGTEVLTITIPEGYFAAEIADRSLSVCSDKKTKSLLDGRSLGLGSSGFHGFGEEFIVEFNVRSHMALL